MITELALLHILPGEAKNFEAAFKDAQKIISSMQGYINHQLQQCLENEHQYLLLVQWVRLEDHTVGFRMSDAYLKWKELLHHFYDPFPIVEHYKLIF